MIDPGSNHRVFLSHTKPDAHFAEQMRGLLTSIGIEVLPKDLNIPAGSVVLDHLRQQATGATITIVLIGPATRFSHWVDQEIEISTKPTKSGPGAGLVGVILPHHEDFSKPYYEPEHVPLRLHDRILAEYAILRKWTANPSEIARWLTEADRRRCQYDATPSIRALLDLRRFPWSEPEDFGPEVSSRIPEPP